MDFTQLWKIIGEVGGFAVAVWVLIKMFDRDKAYREMLENHISKVTEAQTRACTVLEAMHQDILMHTKENGENHRELRQMISDIGK